MEKFCIRKRAHAHAGPGLSLSLSLFDVGKSREEASTITEIKTRGEIQIHIWSLSDLPQAG